MPRVRKTDRDNMLKEAQPKRTPLHEQRRDRLTVEGKDPNYVYRHVTDTDNRIQQFKKAGYEIVEDQHKVGDPDAGSNNSALGSGTRVPVGAGRTGILMRQRKEDYDADQKAKQADITRKENLLIRKKHEEADEEGNYGEVSIGRR